MPRHHEHPGKQAPHRAQHALAILADSLQVAGWQVVQVPEQRGAALPDLLADQSNQRLAIEVKVIAEGRADRLIPLWAQAWLQVQRAAAHSQRIPVAIVAADAVADKAAKAVVDFIRQVAPEACGGVMDLSGRMELIGVPLNGLKPAPAASPRPARAEAAAQRSGLAFSEMNQWMLKVLLAPGIPEALLAAPRDEYRGASELARAAGVSVMSASRLLRGLQRARHLDDEAPRLRLVRLRELLERWQSAVSAVPVVDEAWRALVPAQAQSALEPWIAEEDACWGLFEAARQHGFGLVEGVPPYAYVFGDLAVARLRDAGFVAAREGASADVMLRRPRASSSAFRGIVRGHGAPRSDIIQVWLDVAAHPTRGAEQAALIWRRVLAPLCERASA
jgi:hypothetical protein